MKPLDRVRTANGRMGLVERVYGRQADVMFSEGRETLDVDDLSPLSATPADALLGGHAGDAQAYGLRLQSLFLRHAYRFDPRSGLSNARIEPNLYQIYIAHLVTNKLQPRMILADEVGLGKTIEAGLVLKELRARGVVDRVLNYGRNSTRNSRSSTLTRRSILARVEGATPSSPGTTSSARCPSRRMTAPNHPGLS